jgi:hypothetical protein
MGTVVSQGEKRDFQVCRGTFPNLDFFLELTYKRDLWNADGIGSTSGAQTIHWMAHGYICVIVSRPVRSASWCLSVEGRTSRAKELALFYSACENH